MKECRTGPAAIAFWTVVAAGCQSGLPHRWHDAELGIEVRSDFEPVLLEAMFAGDLHQRVRALRRLFGIDAVDLVTVFVHDRQRWPAGDPALDGWRDAGGIHVMASWDGPELGVPSLGADSVLLHEFVLALVERSEMSLPRWFVEGLGDVLSTSGFGDGGIVWMPNGASEHRARRLHAAGRRLRFAELIGHVDGDARDPAAAELVRAYAASFVWSLVQADPPRDAAAMQAVVLQPRDSLRRRHASWNEALPRTSVASLFRPFVLSEHAAVRRTSIVGLQGAARDDSWWQDVTRLLCDPSRSVRAAMRQHVVSQPSLDGDAVRRYQAWCESGHQQLRRSGLLALALVGELDAGIRLCRDLTASDGEWLQPLMWLIPIVPRADGQQRPLPLELFMPDTGDALHVYALELAAELEALRARLDFVTAQRRYRLRR